MLNENVDLFRNIRKRNINKIEVTQKIIQNNTVYRTKNGKLIINSKAHYIFYMRHVLKRGDKLPRGKFFKGKKAGIPLMILDELWLSI